MYLTKSYQGTGYFPKRFPTAYQFLRLAKRVLVNLVNGLRKPLVNILRVLVPPGFHFGPPKGHFSIVEMLNRGTVRGSVVVKDQGAPHVSKNSMMVLSGLRQHLEQPWPILWSCHVGARLVGPGLALINEDRQLAEEAVYGRSRLRTDPANWFVPLRPAKRLEGCWTSVITRWVPCCDATGFAHWLLEALPRLALLSEFAPNTRILVPQSLQKFQIDSLGWLGLENRYRCTGEQHLLIDQFFFSSPPAMIVCYNPYAVGFLRAKFLSRADPKFRTGSRIFLDRKGPFRSIVNRGEILEFFQEQGWAVVDPSALTLAQQIAVFSQAEAVCGSHGAAFCNAVWCRPGCQLIELFAENYLSGCYEWLAGTVNARHEYLVSPADAMLNAQVNLAELKTLLKRLNLM